MTQDELKALYTKTVRILNAEKRARQWVFRNDSAKQAAKVAEMDEVLATLEWMKDELKARIGTELEQATLIDVPRKAEYH